MTLLHFIHKLLLWFPLALISLVVKVTSPILGLFLSWFIQPSGELPRFLTVFSPDDTPSIGDAMFISREGAWTAKFNPYLQRVLLCYLWSFTRNAGWGFDSKVAGIGSDIEVILSKGDDVKWGYNDQTGVAEYTLGKQLIVAKKGHWNFRTAFKLPFPRKGLLCSFGWNLRGAVKGKRNLKIDVALMNTDRNGFNG